MAVLTVYGTGIRTFYKILILLFIYRHVVRFSILRPTSDLIAQMYYCRGATKIWYAKIFAISNLSANCINFSSSDLVNCHVYCIYLVNLLSIYITPVHLFCLFSELRLDTLSQILTMSNVRAHCRMMVVESCQGMVVGALLERMGGQCIICVYPGLTIVTGKVAVLAGNYSKDSLQCRHFNSFVNSSTILDSQNVGSWHESKRVGRGGRARRRKLPPCFISA